jgi:hypothetical protein
MKKVMFLSLMVVLGSAVESDIEFENKYSCGIFPTALTSFEKILIQQNGIYNTCTISVKDYSLEEDSNHPITCYDPNGDKCFCDPNINKCSINNTCTIIPEPKNKYNYDVLESSVTASYVVDKNWNNNDGGKLIVENSNTDLNVSFKDLEYGSYTFTQDVSEINFLPEYTYKDKDINLMLLKDITFAGNNQLVVFNGGDYYFNSFKIDKNNNGNINQISLCAKDDVRIFVKNDFTYSGNHINDAGCKGKIFIYVEGNAEIDANGGGSSDIPIFLYTKGNVNIENSGDSNNWVGAITAEGDINVSGQNINFIYDTSASEFGYGECPLCYALNNNGQFISLANYLNLEFNFPRTMAIVNDSGEVLNDLNVTQYESNPSWLSITSPEKYELVDNDGNIIPRYIATTIVYQVNIPVLGSRVYSKTEESNNGVVTRYAPVITVSELINTEINTTANFGDYESGGYDNYYAIETDGITASFKGSSNLKYYAKYRDDLGRYYDVELAYCDISHSNPEQEVITGHFDAWDTDHNISDRNITTKIVNKEFNLTLASLNYTNTDLALSVDVKYALMDMDNSKLITSWNDFNASKEMEKNVSFTIPKAYKDVRAVFNVCADYNGKDYTLYDYDQCQYQCPTDNMITVMKPCWRHFYSSDNFAIRPYAFRIFGTNQYKRAGEEFNLTIKAVDEANFNKTSGDIDDVVSVGNYNDTLSNLNVESNFYTPTDEEARIMNKNVYHIDDTNKSRIAYCPDSGVFTVVNNNSLFDDGEINATLKYSETGVLTLKISEIPGHEWASVDADDTNDSQRFIKSTNIISDKKDISKKDILVFIPYKFVTKADYNTTASSDWIYMGNDVRNSNFTFTTPHMAAFIEYDITAYNKDGEITKNFTKTCFPDTTEHYPYQPGVDCPQVNGLKLNTTFDLFLDSNLKSSKDVNVSFYVEDAINKNAIWTPVKNYTLSTTPVLVKELVFPVDFINGNTKVRVYLNIDKNYTIPVEDTNITLVDANTSTGWMNNPGATNIFEGNIVDKEINFKYGRIKVSNASGYSKDLNTTFEYMYWDKDNGWVVNEEHNISFGDIKDYYPKTDLTLIKGSISKGKESIEFTTTHALPYSVKVHFDIPEWLWYHPLAKEYKAPSASNLDCLTHPCAKVIFQKTSSGWAGIGNDESRYNENNKTVKTKIGKDINASRNELRKLNW